MRFAADLPVPEETDPEGAGAQSRRLRTIAAEAFASAVGGPGHPAGPVHLNVPLREPLAGRLPSWLADASAGGAADADPPAADAEARILVLRRGPRTLVLAGADAGPAAEALAHEGSWPLVAEVVSGARFGRTLVHGYRAVLRELGARVERVVVFGHPTLARETTRLLSRPDVEVVAVRGPGESLNLNGATTAAEAVRVAPGEADAAWRSAWMRASRDAAVDVSPPAPDAAGLSSAVPQQRLGAIATELGIIRAPVDRETLVDAVWRATWPHDRLVFGSSRLVRVADEIVAGKRVPVHANRGLAGIDGTIATATGIALASQAAGAAGVTRVLLGDLALLHDAGAFLLPPGEAEPRLQVVVGNDGGGTIFDTLEVASAAEAAALERVQYTPQTVDLAALARAYGWAYQRVTTRSELDQALTAPYPGRSLVEVPLPR